MFSDYAATYLLAMQGQPPGAPVSREAGHLGVDLTLTCLMLGFIGAVGAGLVAG